MARCLVQRHLLYSAIMVCLMGHTAVQKYVAAERFLGFEATIRMTRCRWFEEDMGQKLSSSLMLLTFMSVFSMV